MIGNDLTSHICLSCIIIQPISWFQCAPQFRFAFVIAYRRLTLMCDLLGRGAVTVVWAATPASASPRLDIVCLRRRGVLTVGSGGKRDVLVPGPSAVGAECLSCVLKYCDIVAGGAASLRPTSAAIVTLPVCLAMLPSTSALSSRIPFTEDISPRLAMGRLWNAGADGGCVLQLRLACVHPPRPPRPPFSTISHFVPRRY